MAYTFVLGFVNLGLVMMLYQDKKLLNIKVWQEMIQFFFIKEKFVFKVFFHSLEYFRPNFHPSQQDNLFLMKTVMQIR